MSEEQREKLKERFSNLSDDRKAKLHDKMEAMKERRANMSDENKENMKAKFSEMTPDEKESAIQSIRENRQAEREVRQNMTPEERKAHIDEFRDNAAESRESRVSPYEQISMGADIADIICAEGRELVIKVSDGMPRCIKYDTAATLVDRGVATYPE